MYKVTYVFNLEETTYDLYINEEKKTSKQEYATFDGFNDSSAIIRLYAESRTSGTAFDAADIMIDNIKVLGSG